MESGTATASALTSGFHLAFWIAAGLVVAAIAIAIAVLQPEEKAAEQFAGEEDEESCGRGARVLRGRLASPPSRTRLVSRGSAVALQLQATLAPAAGRRSPAAAGAAPRRRAEDQALAALEFRGVNLRIEGGPGAGGIPSWPPWRRLRSLAGCGEKSGPRSAPTTATPTVTTPTAPPGPTTPTQPAPTTTQP